MEESFPRGGVDKIEAKKSRKEKDLFFQDGKSKVQKKGGKDKKGGKEKKGGKDKKKDGKGVVAEGKKKHKMEGEVSGQIKSQQPQFLSHKTIYPGMLMLGYVKQIKSYSLNIALPNGLLGSVPITKISHAYTESLQKFSEAEGENVENVSTLLELFKVGMVVPCKLTDADVEAGSKGLSIDPKDVNSDLTATNLRHGMIVYGNVSSCEDHGYIIDLGVKGVQAFLKKKQASRYVQLYNEGGPLSVGQCVMCKINMKGDRMAVLAGDNRVINVTIDPLDLKNIETVEGSDIPFTSLIPGMKVHAIVDKVVRDDGIVVEFYKFKGLIHNSHLPKPPSSYNHSDQVTCSILYIHPLTKTVTLTMLPHLTEYVGVPSGLFDKVKVGQIFEEAKVKKTEKHRGVLLDLQNGLTAIAAKNNLSDNDVENIQKIFKKGSTHRCRVQGFYPMEGLVIVSLKQSVLDEKFMKISNFNPGEIVEGKVREIRDKGIEVEVCKGITGFIPKMHLADVTIQHPEQKFKHGDKLKCRILNVKKKYSRLLLTHKKSLVNSKYPIICSQNQVEQGQILEGFIVAVKEYGCLVAFYNDVKGLAPRQMLSTEYIQYPEKVFFVGQVVRCKVMNVDQKTNKFTLTFVLDENAAFPQKPREIPPDFKVGKAVKCKVVKKTATGLDVEVMPSNMKAFLPKMHLSDSMEMSAALWDSYQPGDIIENAMYWNKSRIALLTCKPLLLSAAEIEEEFVTEFDSLVPGMMLPGLVKTIMSYGIFVEFANGLFGLVPLQYALDKRVPDVKLFFPIGMTVSAKVVEIDKDKKRFLASLRMQDCYHGNTEVGINLTWQNLIERETLMDTLAKTDGQKGKLAQIKFGSVHKVTVTKMVKLGAICELENGIKAVVMADHLSGEPSVGDKLDCVVLYVDLEQNCVEVSLDEKLVSLVKKRINKKVVQGAKVGEELKSKVEVIKEDFIVVRLSSHAKGQLAFLPAKRHWNDVLERHQYTIGQPNVVVVKRVEGDMIIASLKVHEERPLEDEDKMSHIASHSLKIGDICDAVIRKIYKDQIYINIGQTHGRVCVTEMLDHVEDGSNPTLNMVKDQEIKVRVIGFRDNRTKRYLPISHPDVSRAMPECSMKPSIMSLEELPENYARSGNSYKIGDKVVTYVDNYSYRYLCSQVAPTVKGRVHQLSLSSDFKVLGNPGEYFKTGQCYNATVTGIVNDKLVDLSFLENPFEELSVGSETKGIITCIKKEIGLVLQLADGVRGTLDITDLSDWYVNQPTSSFKHGSLISAKVIKLEKLSKQAVLSLRKEKEPVDRRIEHVTDLSRGQIVRGYISHVSAKGVTIRLGVDVKFLLPSDRIVQGKVSSWMLKKKFKVGDVICVKFLGFDKDNQVELSVLGNSDHLDILAKPQSDSPGLSEGSKNHRKRSVSNSSADSGVQTKKIKLKNIETANEIDESIELEISGLELMESEALSEKDSTVSSVTSTNSSVTSDSAVKLEDIEEGAFKDWQNLEISVPVIGKGDEDIGERSVTKTSEKIPEKEMSDSSDDESVLWSDEEETEPKILNEGLENINDVSRKSLTVTIIKKGEDRHVQADDEDAVNYAKDQFDELEFENSSTKKRKGKSNNADSVTEYSLEASSEKKKKDRKRTCSASEEDSPNKKQKADTSEVTKVEIKVVPKSEREATKKPVLEVDEGFSWTTDFKLPALKKGEISSDDSDDETQKTRVKKSKAQLLQERKEEENRLYQAEMQRLAGEGEPETVDDYDRLVLQSPDSSLVWLRYMAFHLATSEIDKARAVAERALKTISFREEQERLNVWMAYLNLENLYGTEESIKKVLTRAVQQNDQVTVYLQMVNIYVKSGKTEDAEQLFNTLVKKQSENKEVWIKYGEFYFQQGRVESARKLLQRCLKVLDKKLQVDTIAKFAQMEFKYGEAERGKTLFENILGSYTKRTDLWSVYLDMVTKVGDFEAVRAIYTRLLKKNMSAKKMKFFFKKYLQFEEKHGTPSQVEQVKKNALKYVQSKGFVDE